VTLSSKSGPRPGEAGDVPSYAARLDARAAALATTCVHAGGDGDPTTGALETVVLSNAFRFDDADHAAAAIRGERGFVYSRWENPTVAALEAIVAALEGTEAACATSSGMAAVSGAILALLGQGDHVVAPRAMYSESARLLRERVTRFGIETTFVDATDSAAYERTPTSPSPTSPRSPPSRGRGAFSPSPTTPSPRPSHRPRTRSGSTSSFTR
jgi:hypothetical protein